MAATESTDHPLRVLIVEDSRFVRRVLRLLLEAAGGFTVVGEAEDGLQGLDRARTLAPDVIALDLDLPRLGGLGMLRELRAESPVPVVLVTGLPMLPSELAGLPPERGVSGLVVKTFGEGSLDLSLFAEELVRQLRAAVAASLPPADPPPGN